MFAFATLADGRVEVDLGLVVGEVRVRLGVQDESKLGQSRVLEF